MVYTFRITDSSSNQAQSIINLLNTFAKDYDFLQVITENENILTEEQETELERRYQYYLKHPKEGKNWEEVKANLM